MSKIGCPVKVKTPTGSISAFVEVSLCARDIDASPVYERHVFKNDLQMSEMEIASLFAAIPASGLEPELYGLPSISAYADDEDEHCESVDILEVVLTMQPNAGWDGEDLLSSIVNAPWNKGSSPTDVSAGLWPGF